MQGRSVIRTCAGALAIAALAVPAAASAQAPPAETPPQPPYTKDSFAFAEPSVRAVHLTAWSGARDRGGRRRIGTITVRLRNRTSLTGSLRVRYFPYDGDHASELIGPRAGVGVVSAAVLDGGAARREPVRETRVGPHDYALLRVRFELPRGRPISALDGIVVAQLVTRGTYGPVARLRVRGAAPRVTFDPPKLEMAIQRGLRSPGPVTRKVLVRGPDARALAAAGVPIGRQIVMNGDDAIELTIGPPRRKDPKAGDGVYAADVTVSGIDGLDAGTFTGDVPVTDGRDGPALSVVVTVGFSLVVAVIVVFLGSLLGVLFRRYNHVRRDARLLRLRLAAAVAAYDEQAHPRMHGRRTDAEIASHSLDSWLSPRPTPFSGYRGTRGLAALYWELRTARTVDDIVATRRRVLQVVRLVERWLALEPVARRAEDLLRLRPADRGGQSILECDAYVRAWRLLDEAKAVPGVDVDPAEQDERRRAEAIRRADRRAERLVHDLAECTETFHLAAILWEYLRGYNEMPALSDEDRALVRSYELRGDDGVELPVPAGQNEAQARQTRRLELTKRIDRLRQRWPADRPLPRLGDAALTRSLQEERIGVLSAARIDPSSEIVPARPWRIRIGGFSVAVADWSWTIVRGTVASAVYCLAWHDETWGGSLDAFVTAFVAGFGTEAVGWLAFPAFRSLRAWRSDGGDGPADDEPARDRVPDEPTPAAGGADQREATPALDPRGNGSPAPEPVGASAPRSGSG